MFRHLQPTEHSGVEFPMNKQLTALLEAVWLMQEELLAYGVAKQKGVAIPELTVATFCDVPGEHSVVEAIVHLSAMADRTGIARNHQAPSWWGARRH
jgi:hypothetical protein